MNWKPLVIAGCFAVTMVGCAVDTDDDRAPNVTIRNEERAQPPASDSDVHVGVEHKDTDVDIHTRSESDSRPDQKKDVDIDVDANAQSRPAPNNANQPPAQPR
jgi:hypothetical protein